MVTALSILTGVNVQANEAVVGSRSAELDKQVTAQADVSAGVEFSVEVMAVLSKAGCNAGTCHGNLNGKGGLKLSLRGEDPIADYRALVMAARGRRINLSAPRQSLFLRKATGMLPHRGGTRFESGSFAERVFLQWLSQGAPSPSSSAPTVTDLKVTPTEQIASGAEATVQVNVLARFSDGTQREITEQACYELSNLNATVDASGLVQQKKFGETTLIVRYLNQQVPVPIAFLRERPDFVWDQPHVNNEIDRIAFAKLKRLRINPSSLCDDTVFVRRAYLDALGRIPTAQEARDFVTDSSVDKRTKLIDALLVRPEFADYWALKWADILRTEEKVLDVQGVEVFHGWIREGIAQGKPIDRFVRELVTGVGSTFEQPAANYYRANRDPSTRGETTARLFLGTRLQCAKCHNHPFDRWTQDDYYQWASLFSQLDYEIGENKRKDDLDKNEFAGDQKVFIASQDEVRNPTTGEIAPPKFLGGPQLKLEQNPDRLASLADWLTSPQNDLFARSQANFIWYQLMGRGLVDPIDDFRSTNPASNPALMDHLASTLVESDFDLRSLVRHIMNSRLYQLSSEPNETNQDAAIGFSRALARRLPAEVLLDMQSDVLRVPAKFVGYETGLRAVQIPGVRRKRPRDQAPAEGDRFLKTFGKPERILACDCERSNETTLKQVFVLIGAGLNDRLKSERNRLRQWVESGIADTQIIDDLYWTALSRPPSPQERNAALEVLQNTDNDRLQSLQDIAWAVLNAKEFLFRR